MQSNALSESSSDLLCDVLRTLTLLTKGGVTLLNIIVKYHAPIRNRNNW
jgi:hypothetical protein